MMKPIKTEKWEKYALSFTMNLLLILTALILGRETARYTLGNAVNTKETGQQFSVVIDAGHGGVDPGKVGVNGALEKDVNLAIAKQLEIFLRESDIDTYMTRVSDTGLYDEHKPNKKVQDMKKRLAFINEKKPDLVISIHQNSYEEESVKGAQVFFYKTSIEGKQLAMLLQQQITDGFPEMYQREAKANDSYYLLKKSKVPLIIVECGFLSNWKEAEQLILPRYQEKMAWQIHMAVLKYLKGDKKVQF